MKYLGKIQDPKDLVTKEYTDVYGDYALAAFPTDTASGAIATFPDGADNIPVKALTVDIQPQQSGSGDPSPSNPRPISGWAGAEIVRTGANVWDEEWEQGNINDTTGAKESGTTTFRSKNYIPVKPNTTYYFCGASPIRYIWAYAYDKDKNFIQRIVRTGGNDIQNTAQTTPDNCYFILIKSYNTGSPLAEYVGGLSVNYPSTVTTYSPGTDNATYTVNWTDEAGTVYGGTAEYIGGGQWQGTPRMAIDDLGDFTWIYNSGAFYTTAIASIVKKPPTTSDLGNYLCSALAQKAATDAWTDYHYNVAGNGNLWAKTDGSSNDPAVFKAAVTGYKLVYELATPLTPVIVDGPDPATLYGNNNVWADCGPIQLEYRIDPQGRANLSIPFAPAYENVLTSTVGYTAGKYLDASGNEQTASGFNISPEILVIPGRRYIINFVQPNLSLYGGWFNSSHTWIANYQNGAQTAPATAAYLKINILSDYLNTIGVLEARPDAIFATPKKIVGLGDSYIAGTVPSSLTTEQHFLNLLKRKYNWQTVVRDGIVGARIASYPGDSYSSITMAERWKSLPNDADIVFVMGGSNDWSSTALPLGSPSDTTNISFYGGLNYMLAGLIRKYLGKQIYFITPLHMANDTTVNTTTNLDLAGYINIIKERCAYYGIPVIDVFNDAWLPYSQAAVLNGLFADGHPDATGQIQLARCVSRYIET